jgi:hypothetical protein
VPPSTRDSILKASLTILEPKPGGGTSELDSIEFPFNPKEWSITHSAEWKTETTKKGTPPPEFKGPKPASASVEIFLDESDKDGGDISTTWTGSRRWCRPRPAACPARSRPPPTCCSSGARPSASRATSSR